MIEFLHLIDPLNICSNPKLITHHSSKWGRYADYPAARGRALCALCLQLLPYMFITPVASLFKREKLEKRLKVKGGDTLSNGLLKLGPLYIKIGQILSCRENLLPEEWVKSLERLQDKVPAKSGQDARELAYSAFGSKKRMEEILESFDDVPLAAASLGQVHMAVLRPEIVKDRETEDMKKGKKQIQGGTPEKTKVAIKVQRARLRDIYDKDLALMLKIAKFGDKFSMTVGGAKQSWTDIFTDTEKILYREIDYVQEAENAMRFAKDFGLGLNGTSITPTNPNLPSAASWLRTPYIYEDLSSEKILVQEYLPTV